MPAVVMAIQPTIVINCMSFLASIFNTNSSLQLPAQDLRPPSHPVSRNTSLKMVGATMRTSPEVHIRDIIYGWEPTLNFTAYHFPNDDPEQDRLDMFHHIILLGCDGKLHLAPIRGDGMRILDIGCGTGIWAIQMGMIIHSRRWNPTWLTLQRWRVSICWGI
jgi:hypothetical protein